MTNNNKILITSIIAIATILGFSGIDQQAHAFEGILDEALCLAEGGDWTTSPDTCTFFILTIKTISSGETLIIPEDVTLGEMQAIIVSVGGTLENHGNLSQVYIIIEGTVINIGSTGYIAVMSTGTLNNYGFVPQGDRTAGSTIFDCLDEIPDPGGFTAFFNLLGCDFCGVNTTYNLSTLQCEGDSGPTVECGTGTELNESTNECEPDVTQDDLDALQSIIDNLNNVVIPALEATIAFLESLLFDGAETEVCHKPGTNQEKTLTSSSNKLIDHLDHGDTLGACEA